jgi:hypothetical protein
MKGIKMTTINPSELEKHIEKLYGVAAILEHMTDTRGIVENNNFALRLLEESIYEAIEGIEGACSEDDDSENPDACIESDE